MLTTRRRANRYRDLLLLSGGLALACVALSLAVPQGCVVLLPIALVLFLCAVFYLLPRYESWSSGAEGEEQVVAVLSSLPGCYVLHDIVLPGQRGNIDHIVVAPSGVCVVETKNYTGTIRCVDDSWERLRGRGRRATFMRMERDPGAQARRNAVMLSEYIYSRLRLDLWIGAIICFPHPRCELVVCSSTTRIARLDGLRDAILDQRSSRGLSLEEMTRVWHALEGGGAARGGGGHVWID